MTVPAYKFEAVNRLGVRILATLKRCDPPIPDSLRLTAAQVVKDGIIKRLMGDPEVHPGMKRIAAWGKCSERQARRNVREMERWGLLVPLSRTAGGRKFATEYWVEPEALIRFAVTARANPHPDLMAELRDLIEDRNPDIKADRNPDMKPGHMAGHMSARLRIAPKRAADGVGGGHA